MLQGAPREAPLPYAYHMQNRIDAWLEAACADAERRGLPELKPLLETLARSARALREAEPRVEGPGPRHPARS